MTGSFALLKSYDCWLVKTVNRRGHPPRYDCTIWHGGRRVTANRATPEDAINGAIAKWKEKAEPKFKVVG